MAKNESRLGVKSKRHIIASKGGRTARAPEARMTPSERAALDEILKRRGVSFADWIVEQINRETNGAAQMPRKDTTQEKGK